MEKLGIENKEINHDNVTTEMKEDKLKQDDPWQKELMFHEVSR